MYCFPILLVCILFTFHTISDAQDSTAEEDSLLVLDTALIETVSSNIILIDTESAEKKSALTETKAVLSVASFDTSDTSIDTASLQIVDSTIAPRLKDSLFAGKEDSVKSNIADTIMQKKAVKIITKNIKNIIRLILHYFRHFIALIVSCSLIFFTIFFYRKKIDSRRFLTSTRLSVMDKEVQIACKYMESHFDDPELSVETICREIVTGTAFLEALFDRELGMSVSEFLTQVRINRAKIILKKKPDVTVEELISKVGFSDSEKFLQNFKRITGINFKDYQTSLHQHNTD